MVQLVINIVKLDLLFENLGWRLFVLLSMVAQSSAACPEVLESIYHPSSGKNFPIRMKLKSENPCVYAVTSETGIEVFLRQGEELEYFGLSKNGEIEISNLRRDSRAQYLNGKEYELLFRSEPHSEKPKLLKDEILMKVYEKRPKSSDTFIVDYTVIATRAVGNNGLSIFHVKLHKMYKIRTECTLREHHEDDEKFVTESHDDDDGHLTFEYNIFYVYKQRKSTGVLSRQEFFILQALENNGNVKYDTCYMNEKDITSDLHCLVDQNMNMIDAYFRTEMKSKEITLRESVSANERNTIFKFGEKNLFLKNSPWHYGIICGLLGYYMDHFAKVSEVSKFNRFRVPLRSISPPVVLGNVVYVNVFSGSPLLLKYKIPCTVLEDNASTAKFIYVLHLEVELPYGDRFMVSKYFDSCRYDPGYAVALKKTGSKPDKGFIYSVRWRTLKNMTIEQMYRRGDNSELILVGRNLKMLTIGDSPHLDCKIEGLKAAYTTANNMKYIWSLDVKELGRVEVKLRTYSGEGEDEDYFYETKEKSTRYPAPVDTSKRVLIISHKNILQWRVVIDLEKDVFHLPKPGENFKITTRSIPDKTLSKKLESKIHSFDFILHKIIDEKHLHDGVKLEGVQHTRNTRKFTLRRFPDELQKTPKGYMRTSKKPKDVPIEHKGTPEALYAKSKAYPSKAAHTTQKHKPKKIHTTTKVVKNVSSRGEDYNFENEAAEKDGTIQQCDEYGNLILHPSPFQNLTYGEPIPVKVTHHHLKVSESKVANIVSNLPIFRLDVNGSMEFIQPIPNGPGTLTWTSKNQVDKLTYQRVNLNETKDSNNVILQLYKIQGETQELKFERSCEAMKVQGAHDSKSVLEKYKLFVEEMSSTPQELAAIYRKYIIKLFEIKNGKNVPQWTGIECFQFDGFMFIKMEKPYSLKDTFGKNISNTPVTLVKRLDLKAQDWSFALENPTQQHLLENGKEYYVVCEDKEFTYKQLVKYESLAGGGLGNFQII